MANFAPPMDPDLKRFALGVLFFEIAFVLATVVSRFLVAWMGWE